MPRRTASARGRRAKEALRPSYNDRREIDGRISGRTKQMNLKVRPEWHAQLLDAATAKKLMLVEIMEQGFELWRMKRARERGI